MRSNIISLKKDLKSYGLNPADWKFKTLQNNKAILVHRQVKEFCLKGSFSKAYLYPKWSDLSLM